MKELVIDATGLVVGRLAAFCAKNVLNGRKVEVSNIEKAVISGNPKRIVQVYKKRRGMTNPANPEEAAKWPRRPDFLFKRILNGMLPNGKRGKQAAENVKAYMGEHGKPNVKTPVSSSSELRRGFISLGELCSDLGWHRS